MNEIHLIKEDFGVVVRLDHFNNKCRVEESKIWMKNKKRKAKKLSSKKYENNFQFFNI